MWGEFRRTRANAERGQPRRLARQSKAPQKIPFSLGEKEIGRAQNEKNKEYFFAVRRVIASGGGAASNDLSFSKIWTILEIVRTVFAAAGEEESSQKFRPPAETSAKAGTEIQNLKTAKPACRQAGNLIKISARLPASDGNHILILGKRKNNHMFTTKTYMKDFKYFKEKYDESMERMFAAVSDLYAEYWNDFFHFALFKDEDESWESAFKNTHKKYLEALRIKDVRKVLELACGRGGFTNILAENTSGEVLGIDISRSQLSRTKRFKRPNLRFKHHDIMKVDELGEMFDAVVLMDADCYLPDKRLAVEKISKVMNPGARFLLLGWCKQSGLSQIQEELVLHPFMKYWAIPSLETPENYKKYFKQSGFRIVEITDLNNQVRRDWDFGYESALKGIKKLSLKDLPRLLWKGIRLGSDGIRLIKEQFPAAIYIKVGFDVGFLRYVYFLVEKK